MPSIASFAAIAGLAGLAIASPLEKRAAAGSFRLDQVVAGPSRKVGPVTLQRAYQKYSAAVPANVAAAAAVSGSVVATPEQYDSEYLCPVTIGSTTLNLDFDTGSADLWVFSDKLTSAERGSHSFYKTSTSKQMAGESWSISYGDGSGASGKVYADKVVIGPVTATSQAVEAATSVSSQFVSDTQNDGLVGLAFSSINTVTPKPAQTFFDTVKGSLATALFAADLKFGAAGSYDFGVIDSSKFQGDIVYTAVDSSQGFWMFTADGYSINGKSGPSITGIADTGTTLMLLDDSVVTAYWSQVSGSVNDATQGGYTFPCKGKLPDFSLVIGGQTRTIPGAYMNYAPVDSTGATCFGGLQSSAGIGFSIFGDIFLKSQYVVFDASQGSPRIGFGQQ